METRSNVCGGSEPLKNAMGAAKRQSGHQKISNDNSMPGTGQPA